MYNKKRKISVVYTSKYTTSFKKDRVLHLMIITYLIFFIVLSIKPVDNFIWWFENSVSLIAVVALIALYRRFRLTNSSYVLIMLLMILHAIGAHYTYLYCPVGGWMKTYFGFKRNNYDRFMCLAFGLLLTLPVIEVLYHRLRLRYIQACALSCEVVITICALYELAKIYCSMLLSSEQTILFLAAQGDLWDAQNDMALVLLGTLITMCSCILLKIYKNNKIHMLKKKNN
jgi:putative membrane protein